MRHSVHNNQNQWDRILYCARFLRRLAKQEEFQIGQVKIDDERVSDEILMCSNLQSKKVDLQKLLKLLSAEMPVI